MVELFGIKVLVQHLGWLVRLIKLVGRIIPNVPMSLSCWVAGWLQLPLVVAGVDVVA